MMAVAATLVGVLFLIGMIFYMAYRAGEQSSDLKWKEGIRKMEKRLRGDVQDSLEKIDMDTVHKRKLADRVMSNYLRSINDEGSKKPVFGHKGPEGSVLPKS